jgi:general secretion pathway protein G
MVVLLILAMLASIAAPRVTKYLKKAKAGTAKVQVEALRSAVDSFHLDVGHYPRLEEGLKALVDSPANEPGWDGPYLIKRNSLIDPWGRPYLYATPGKSGEFDVYTYGSDGREGGTGEAADIGSW